MHSRVYLVFALMTALSIGLLAQPSARSLLPMVPNAHAANITIVLTGFASAWNASTSKPNPTITVSQGDVVTIKLSSGDPATHQFALDVDRDGAKFTGSCSPGDTCSMQFTPSTPTSIMIDTTTLSGTYTYFCTIHSMMFGSFVVVGGAVGGATLPMDKMSLFLPYFVFAALVAIALVSAVFYTRSRREKSLVQQRKPAR
jgi:plastocyanin